MESLVKSDIFFFVTTFCVIIITVFLVMILVNVLWIMQSVKEILNKMKDEADDIAREFAAFRVMAKETQFGLKPIIDSLRKRKIEMIKTTRIRVRKVKKAVADAAENIKEGIEP